MSREGLDGLINVVRRIIEKEFGTLVKEKEAKHGKKKFYNLNKPVAASLELVGNHWIDYRTDPDPQIPYNPHINVLIFEDIKKGNSPRIDPKKLERLKRSYQRALQGLLRTRIDKVDIHYSYKYEVSESIWYVTKPMHPEICGILGRKGDLRLSDFLMIGLSNFRFIRLWGSLANSEYKKHLKQRSEDIFTSLE